MKKFQQCDSKQNSGGDLLKVQMCTFPFQLSAEIVSENTQENCKCQLKLKCREASGCSLSWEWTERDSMLWRMTGNKFKETHQNHCKKFAKKYALQRKKNSTEEEKPPK